MIFWSFVNQFFAKKKAAIKHVKLPNCRFFYFLSKRFFNALRNRKNKEIILDLLRDNLPSTNDAIWATISLNFSPNG
jgi:hypothetical protein